MTFHRQYELRPRFCSRRETSEVPDRVPVASWVNLSWSWSDARADETPRTSRVSLARLCRLRCTWHPVRVTASSAIDGFRHFAGPFNHRPRLQGHPLAACGQQAWRTVGGPFPSRQRGRPGRWGRAHGGPRPGMAVAEQYLSEQQTYLVRCLGIVAAMVAHQADRVNGGFLRVHRLDERVEFGLRRPRRQRAPLCRRPSVRRRCRAWFISSRTRWAA